MIHKSKDEVNYLVQLLIRQSIKSGRNVYLLKIRTSDIILILDDDLARVYISFYVVKTIEVGPGSYDDRTITADGHFILSNMKSSGRRTINQGKKKSIFEKTEHIPGPG